MKVNCRSSGPQIGAVLKKFAPFLKLYTDYIKNFDNATSVITLWTSKSAKFMAFLDELQVQCYCHLIFVVFILFGCDFVPNVFDKRTASVLICGTVYVNAA